MKHVKALVHRHRTADLFHALVAAGFDRAVVLEVKGVVTARNPREQQYSVEFGGAVINEVQVELFCNDQDVPVVVDLIRQHGRTGQSDAGWVYVLPVEGAFLIDARADRLAPSGR
jgi:nitrogen regulatory protein PII